MKTTKQILLVIASISLLVYSIIMSFTYLDERFTPLAIFIWATTLILLWAVKRSSNS